ncbi:MAG TPA: flippase [Chloroflexaceae bacterium]|nr:flippase [Chloroflexaceae bacterium]
MNSTTTPTESRVTAQGTGSKRQIRGSSLLLAGRLISTGANLVVQVLTVNYLSKTDYGAFAYALSIVALGETIVTLGLDRAITRFVPIYHEREDYPRLFGTIALVIGAIISLSLVFALGVFGLQRVLAQQMGVDEFTFSLLLILLALAPIQAFDTVIMGLFATFASPRAIFVRRHMLTPGLRLATVALLIVSQGSVYFLALGYVVSGALAVALYIGLVVRLLRDVGLLQQFKLRGIVVPARDVLTFTIPLLSSDLVYVVMHTVDAVMLEMYHSTAEVAAFRAVQPAARLNQLVLTSFALLFTPVASRLFARNDREGINTLYWQTAVWIAVVSFPIFALSFSLAEPLTLTLFGERYADSAAILAALSFGYYINAAFGQNGLALKVVGRLRYIVLLNIAAALVNFGLNLLLIPRYGALGAAIGTAIALVVHNIFKQIGLSFDTGISVFERRYLGVYISIAVAAAGLLAVQMGLQPPFFVGFVLAALVSLVVLYINRAQLRIGSTFPELLRVPFVRKFFGE